MNQFINKVRALVLMSGGLDSILAAKILSMQGIEAVPLCFTSYFFSDDLAREAVRSIGMTLRSENISRPHLEIVKHPHYGYGSAINPCIDCHLLMLKTAKGIMESEDFDFIATGEVLGERPMSQNKQSLDVIEKESGLTGFLLRPLSAKLLPPIAAEMNGLVDRDKLYDISGRSRKPQLELARRFGLNYIPQPGGGCILTEVDYGKKIKDLLSRCPVFEGNDVQILRYGRSIWIGDLLIVIARNIDECELLRGLVKSGDVIFEPQNFAGPLVLARNFGVGLELEEIVSLGKKYLLQYSKKIPLKPEISIKELN